MLVGGLCAGVGQCDQVNFGGLYNLNGLARLDFK